MMADYNQLRPDDERTREVVSLGLTYNLLTAYTSFVATDETVERLGTSLKLPPSLEAARPELERMLPPVKLPAARGGEADEAA